ncbi:helix-turn-helix domain-containing protein [Lapidilactobacillus mulanensis]|nr:helix-turn-helix domain-containing protein [Lapidilactobacillus mulanensis]
MWLIFEEIFFDRNELKKFQLFEMISTNQSSLHTLTEIASVLKLSYQQTYNTYKDLLLDLNDIDPDREIMSSKMKEVVSQQSDISVDVYRLYLLRKSIAFQALNYAATTKNTDMAAFTNQYFISKSTLIRKLDKLRVLLRRYDINLSITTLKLSGSELKI